MKNGSVQQAINVDLYGDGSREARRRAEYLYCEHAEECSAYKKGQCFGKTSFLSPRCKFANIQKVDGGTRRSKAYYTVSSKAKADPSYAKLTYPNNSYMAKIDDGMLLFFPFISIKNDGEKIICNHPGFGRNCVFIENDKITVENIAKICNFRPKPMFGNGEIEGYRSRVIPMFLRELKQVMPEFYAELIEKNKELAELIPDYKGKMAKLSTINRNCIINRNGCKFEFDGDYIACKNYKSAFLPFGADAVEMRIRINDDLRVEITDNEQVTDETEFL